MDVRSAQADLPHDVGAPRAGRRFVTSVLGGWGVSAVAMERTVLLVSELVSNAVLHGGGPVRLVITETDDGRSVRVEVRDHGTGQPQMRHPSPAEVSGRGLQLVDELARGWGSTTDGELTSVWFEVLVDAAG